MLNSWRNTHPLVDMNSRMAKSIGSTSVSIMITALTDGLSFAVGTISQFPAVSKQKIFLCKAFFLFSAKMTKFYPGIFCTYCALAILCSFLYQMTFFVACMAICARRETANRHCLCLFRVHPKNESSKKLNFLVKS